MKTKRQILQSLTLAIFAFATLPLASLQAAEDEKKPEADTVVMCPKCQTVWVNRPVSVGGSNGKGGTTVYRKEKAMKCDECQNAVITFFKTGKLQHECKACGSELSHCKAH